MQIGPYRDDGTAQRISFEVLPILRQNCRMSHSTNDDLHPPVLRLSHTWTGRYQQMCIAKALDGDRVVRQGCVRTSASASASHNPYSASGSGSGKPIKKVDRRSIRKRDHAHSGSAIIFSLFAMRGYKPTRTSVLPSSNSLGSATGSARAGHWSAARDCSERRTWPSTAHASA
jgi:hypothetical protein